jgi:hypothetical protein
VSAHLCERDSNNNSEIRYGNIAACQPVVPFQELVQELERLIQFGKFVCVGALSFSDGRLQHKQKRKSIYFPFDFLKQKSKYFIKAL